MIEFLISLPMIVLALIAFVGISQPKWRGICWPLLIGSGVGQLALLYSLSNPWNAINTYVAIDSFVALWLTLYAVKFKSEKAISQALILGVAVLVHALLAFDVEYKTNMVYVYYEYAIATLTFLQCYLLRGVFDGFVERIYRNKAHRRRRAFTGHNSSFLHSNRVAQNKEE